MMFSKCSTKTPVLIALLAAVSTMMLSACESNPAKAEETAANAADERCFVTGSRLPKNNCQDSGVGSISRETWTRKLGELERPGVK
jgi:uncharacterized membrane protein